ncbi:cytochrome c oxidase subunit II [Bosea sp. RCC_152_1]|uniref:cytochrome c oxidase subunit II n=1 Tax=Bosea sp. RCC_152_1 TaxID=3239228 RepID=UPI0035259F41
MRSRAGHIGVVTLAALPAAGCAGWQSALDPHSPQAQALAELIGVIVLICGVVWLLVVLVLACAIWRRRPLRPQPLALDQRVERRMSIAVGSAVALTAVTLVALTALSFIATRKSDATAQEPLVIRLRAFQWWWEVTYLGQSPDEIVVTANEIHVPVGQPVRVELVAADVIHSFWVPSLAGKQDMIPGRQNALTFTARREGVYRGQCAEFCGVQHAHMAFLVVAQPPEAFEAWLARQRAPAAAPADAEQEAGRAVFMSRGCAACHSVRGTQARGRLGPDLTHVGSRRMIAAGLVETTRGSLAAWIADPQTMKPGNAMPMVSLSGDELRAVSAYMAGLR